MGQQTNDKGEAVDVLAAMRRGEACCYYAAAFNAARLMKEARAAVAGLIEQATWADSFLAGFEGDELQGIDANVASFRAALARCQPADIPTELNVDTDAPVAPERDMAAEAREANERG